jgi:hypothetical protein
MSEHAEEPPLPKLKKPPVLFSKTQRLLAAIAEETGGTVLSYWNSPAGSVCQDDVLALYEVLQRIGEQDELYVFIKSNGGDGTAALRIANLLRRQCRRLVAVLPLECASAATMIALGADELRMGPLAFVTAVDTSLIHALSPVDVHNRQVSVSQDELNRAVSLWRQSAGPDDAAAAEANPYSAMFQYVHPLVIGAVDRSSSLSVKLCTEILGLHMTDAERARAISVQLNSAYPAHNYPILLDEARRVGLNAVSLSPRLNDLLLDLHELYSEMGQEAVTDFDQQNYHNNEIVNIIESSGIQVHFQNDKDWHYRVEERRWDSMNDSSSWRKVERVNARTTRSVLHIR